MQVPYQMVTLDELLLDDSKPVCFDTETCGFYGKIRLAQFYQEGDPYVQMVEWPDQFQLMILVGKYSCAMHNSHYDITTLQQQTSTRWVPKEFFDTFLAARIAIPYLEKYDLESLLTHVLGYDPYSKQGLDKKKLQKSRWDGVLLTNSQKLYAATDVYYMPALINKVNLVEGSTIYHLDLLTVRYCCDFQWNGLPVNHETLRKRFQANQAELEELDLPINVNSYVQVRKYLNTDTSDDLALAHMETHGSEAAGHVRRARKLLKQNNFLGKFETEDGRIYGKFKPSARSGRLTSNDQNLQQLPRELKNVFEAQPGRILMYADYSQLELRTIAAITACIAMCDLLKDGGDAHNYAAELIYGREFTKHERLLAKCYNFLLLYGGGINMLINTLVKMAGIVITDEQAYKDKSRWLKVWVEIAQWQKRGVRDWKAGRLGSTPLGRKYKAKMLTDQLNIQNQGAGAEVSKLALHYLMPKLKAYNENNGTDFMLCNFVHDSYTLEGPDEPEHYKPVAMILAESMQEGWLELSKCCQVKDIPMPVTVCVGANLDNLEEEKDLDYCLQLDGYHTWNSQKKA